MNDHSKTNLYLPMIAIALMLTPAVGAAVESGVYVGNTLRDIELVASDSPHNVTVVLEREGRVIAREARTFESRDGPISLQGLTATALVAANDSEFTTTPLAGRVYVDNELALGVVGIPTRGPDGELLWRSVDVTWPVDSPLRPNGERLMTFTRGWSTDHLTLALAPVEGANLSGAAVLIQAWAGSNERRAALLNHTQVPISMTPDGHAIAMADFDRLPPLVTWSARLEQGGRTVATVWSDLDFAIGRSTNGGYDPGSPALVRAAYSKHRVEAHKDAVTVFSGVLTSSWDHDLAEGCTGRFDRIEGADVQAFAGSFGAAEDGCDAASTTVPERPAPIIEDVAPPANAGGPIESAGATEASSEGATNATDNSTARLTTEPTEPNGACRAGACGTIRSFFAADPIPRALIAVLATILIGFGISSYVRRRGGAHG